MREYSTIRALNQGVSIDFEGVAFRKTEGEIHPGDIYIAERNTGPKLLTCLANNKEHGFIVPKAQVFPEYCYDTHECVKVEMVEETA